MTAARRAAAGAIAAWSIVLGATATFATLAYRLGAHRYAIFRAGVDDGIFMQVILSAFHGSHARAEGGLDHLGVHFSPILYALAPLVWLRPSALTLVAVQALAVASVAVPVFLFARRRMPPLLASVTAGVTLLYPPLSGLATADFHEHAFTPAAIAWTIWAVDARKPIASFVFAAIALAIKEDVGVVLALDGIAAALWFRRCDPPRARLAATIGIAATIVVALYFTVVRPLTHPGPLVALFHFYVPGGIAASPAGFVGPGDPIRPRYLAAAFVPLGLLPLASPLVLLALPGFVEVLASREAITMQLAEHYAAIWIPFVLLAFVAAVGRVAARSRSIAVAVLVAVAVFCRHVLLHDDPFARWYYVYRPVDAADRTLAAFLRTLPPDADVGVNDDVYAHLGRDPNATTVLAGARYLLLDTLHEYPHTDVEAAVVAHALSDGTYRRLPAPAGIVFLERRDSLRIPVPGDRPSSVQR